MRYFAIMRCKKLKTMGCVASALQHCFRERETLNADPEMTPENVHLAAASSNEAMGLLRSQLPEKYRKDAVLAVEYVMTASPEWWENATEKQQEGFFRESLEWLQQKYGKDRVIAATVHRDELTPHLSAFVVPLTEDGRLSAKQFVGNRSVLRNDQTTFANKVARFGLQRGVEGSPARHQRVKAHYAAIQTPIEHPQMNPEAIRPQVVKKGVFRDVMETPEQIVQRINLRMHEVYEPLICDARETRQARENARKVMDHARAMQRDMGGFYDVLRNLPSELYAPLLSQFQDKAAELQREQQRKAWEREENARREELEQYYARKAENKPDSRPQEPGNTKRNTFAPPKP